MRGWFGDHDGFLGDQLGSALDESLGGRDGPDPDVRARFGRVTGLPAVPDEPPDEPLPPVKPGALAAFDPGRRGLRALAVVAAIVVCIAAFFAWQARPHPAPVPAVHVATNGPPPVAASSGATATVVVAVAGRVQHPGLVRLPAGARVADAIEAAGGALPNTDLSFVNLARKVVDGELIVVGVTPPPGAAVAAGPGGGTTPGAGALVNLNTASLAELQTLPGVGAVIAQRIVEYREQHGGFRSVDDLRQVSGIGDAKFAQLKDRVTV